VHLVGIIYYNIITMHGPMNIKYDEGVTGMSLWEQL